MAPPLLANDVFTPTRPATHTFVERDESTSRRIEQAFLTPGMQVVVYGPTGSGKTTLVRNKLTQLGPDNTITCRCTSTSTFAEIVTSAFTKLDARYTAEETRGGAARAGQIGGSFLGTGVTLGYTGKSKPATTKKSVTPPPVTVEQLGEYLGRANANLIIEDLHKVNAEEKARVAEAMKLFMDLAGNYPKLRIIALGARDTAEDILRLDSEMTNRVAEIGVDPMSLTELKTILGKGEDCLNIEFPPIVADRIASFSCGMPAVAHRLALTMCFEAGIAESVPSTKAAVSMGAELLEAAIRIYVEDQAASFRTNFEAATRSVRKSKYDNYSTILWLLSYAPDGLTRAELLERIRRRYSDYPASNLDRCLKILVTNGQRGTLILKDTVTQKHRFEDPRACAYAAMRFAAQKWADYCVVAADLSNNLIDRVRVRRDEGKTLTDEQTWNRAELVDAMLKGTTFVTSVMGESGWQRINQVALVKMGGERFLRVDALQLAFDHLDALPTFSERNE